jgi:hypothetical protein
MQSTRSSPASQSKPSGQWAASKHYSKMSVNFCSIIWCYVAEGATLDSHRHDNSNPTSLDISLPLGNFLFIFIFRTLFEFSFYLSLKCACSLFPLL